MFRPGLDVCVVLMTVGEARRELVGQCGGGDVSMKHALVGGLEGHG